MEKNDWNTVVVGAGLAGLSCAFTLASQGKKVLVLEAKPYPGGRTASFMDDGMAVESGLHRYIGYYTALPRLLHRCGVSMKEVVTWEEKAEILRPEGADKLVLGLAPLFGPVKTARGILENSAALSLRDKLSLVPFFLGGFTVCLFSQKLDHCTVAEYAGKCRVTEQSRRLILETLSSGIFFLPPEEYSAYAFFGLFAPAVRRFYKMRIGAFLGGMSEVLCRPIVEKIQSLGGEVVLQRPVHRLLCRSGEVSGVETADGQRYTAENTVLATELSAAKKLVAPLPPRRELRKLLALPVMSACTLQLELDEPALEKDITTFGPGTDMVSFAEQSRTTFRQSRGRLSVILGHPEKYAAMDTGAILAAAEKQLGQLGVHVEGHVLAARKVAEKDGFYSLGPGSQALRPRQRSGIPGLTLAGDYTRTASFATMEGAVLSGIRAAGECERKRK